MVIGNAPVDEINSAGSSSVVLPKRTMALKKISVYISILGVLTLCSRAAYAAPEAAKNKTEAAVAASAEAFELQAKDADPEKRAQAAAGLAELKVGKKAEVLKTLLNDKDARVKAVAARGLARDGDAAAYPVLAEALDGADGEARLVAIEGLASLKDARAEKPLIALLDHKELNTRWKAVESLGNFKGKGAVEALMAKAAEESEDPNIRRSALTSLVKIGDKAAIPGLKAFKSPKAPMLEKLAAKAAAALEKRK